MSASRTPTVRPRAASAAARFAVIDDLPTPPLPLPTAMTRVVAGTSVAGADCDAAQARLLHERRALVLGHLVVLDADLADARAGRRPWSDVGADLAPERARRRW